MSSYTQVNTCTCILYYFECYYLQLLKIHYKLFQVGEAFACTKDSPTTKPPVWSKTTPKVALTHIFCGEITSGGRAQGMHSLPGKTDPPSAITSNACAEYNGFECRSDVEIYNSKTDSYLQKTPQISKQLFFVKSIAETVTYLTTLYNSAHCRGIMKQDKKICVHDTNAKIVIALVIKNASMDILTAYPFRVEDISSAKCDDTCNYP